MAGNLGEAEEIIRQARKRGLTMPVLGGDGLEGIQDAGSLAEGVYLSSPYFAAIPNPGQPTLRRGIPEEVPRRRPAESARCRSLRRDLPVASGHRQGRHEREDIRRALAGVGTTSPPFEGVSGTVAFDTAGDVSTQNVYIGLVRTRRRRGTGLEESWAPMNPLRSVRGRVIAGMVLLIGLVFVIALLGVNSIRALDRSVNQESRSCSRARTSATGWCRRSRPRCGRRSNTSSGPRPRPVQMIEDGDSAFAYQRRYRALGALTTADRYIVNKIAANQAPIEVQYGLAHALTDLGRLDEARRAADQARAPADTLLGDVRALGLAQTQPVDGPGRRPAQPGGGPAASSLGPLRRVAPHRRAHGILDGPLGRPATRCSDRRGREVRCRRSSADSPRRGHPERDRTASPARWTTWVRRLRRVGPGGEQRGGPDREQRHRFLGGQRAVGGEQR